MTGVSNNRLGMMLLVGTETILFSTFIGAYLVLRGAAVTWPPFGTPHLTAGLSSINTAVLLVSSLMIWRRRIGLTFILGSLFLLLQVFEFHRLYARGLTLQTGTYGALFYTLVTCHGLHVLGGLAILTYALSKQQAASSKQEHRSLLAARRSLASDWAGHAEIYWHFVTGVWLVLFSILYIV